MKKQSNVMNKFMVASVSTALIATSVAPIGYAASFKDVSSSYKDAVNYLSSKGVVGFSQSHFGVDKKIKRVDAAVMLAKVLNLDIYSAENSGFKDVPKRAVPYVNALKEVGIVQGVSPAIFNSNSLVTRGEIAMMIQRTYGLVGTSKIPFKDVPAAFKSAVTALYDNNIIKGISKNKFGTGLPVKRGDYANILYRVSNLDTNFPNPDFPKTFDIVEAQFVNETTVEVMFSKDVDSISASNFSIPTATVTAVKLNSSNKKIVTLTVKDLVYSQSYVVRASGVKVNKVAQPTVSANFRSDAPPAAVKVNNVRFVNTKEIEVEFSRAVDAVKANNFSIDGVAVTAAKLSKDHKVATLTLKELAYSTTYVLKVDGIRAYALLQPAVSTVFTSNPGPNGAYIAGVNYLTNTEMDVIFAKPVDSVSIKNFSIPGVTITAAKLGADKKTVRLTVKQFAFSTRYTVTSTGVKQNGVVQASSSYSFWSGPVPYGIKMTKASYLSPTEVEVEFSSMIDAVKATNFTIDGAKVSSAKLSADRKKVTLKVSELYPGKTYKITAISIRAQGIIQDNSTISFNTPTAPSNVKIKSATYVNETQVSVVFTLPVDGVKNTNFLVKKKDGTDWIADTVVTAAKMSADKRTVLLTVQGMEPSQVYQVEAFGIKLAGITQASMDSLPFNTPEAPKDANIESAVSKTKTQVEVKFPKAIDAVKPENFSIDGVMVLKATLNSDRRTVVLTVSDLDYYTEANKKQYTVVAKMIKINGKTQSSSSKTFDAPVEPKEVEITEVKYLSQTQAEVKFSREIDAVKTTNFVLNAIDVDGNVVDELKVKTVKLDANKKTVLLTFNELDYVKPQNDGSLKNNYRITATKIYANKELQPDSQKDFRSAAVDEVWELFITPKTIVQQPNRSTEIAVDFMLLNKQTGKVDTTANDILLGLSVKDGIFAEKTIIMKGGKASTIITVPVNITDDTVELTTNMIKLPTSHSYLDQLLKGGNVKVDIPIKAKNPDFEITRVQGFAMEDGSGTIEITFSGPVQISNAISPDNYTLDGKKLDEIAGTKVTAADNNGNVSDGYEKIVITVPEKTLKVGTSYSITIDGSKIISNNFGKPLVGETHHFFIAEKVVVEEEPDKTK